MAKTRQQYCKQWGAILADMTGTQGEHLVEKKKHYTSHLLNFSLNVNEIEREFQKIRKELMFSN